MAKNSRVPSAVGSIPVVGDLVKQADSQAQWLQDMIEQNARLVGQLPATIKSFNDSLEQFNKTVGRLDKVVTRIDGATQQLVGPLEQITPQLSSVLGTVDLKSLSAIPEKVEALVREAGPALRAATDTQKQVALLAATLDRLMALLNELPGAGLVRRFASGRLEDDPPAVPAD